ncbi:MAG TPA: LysM peptidoglycan-binding domain-containing protein, partial [Tepidisphaeraceae bacterium]|nr:LysM peptidoglycan-binding domain-containing protein [Tepidisphaeraceae bacterium]
TTDLAAAHVRVHRVEAGETMVSIARAAYGDGRYYQAILNANPSVNPNRLKPGTVLHLPPASQVKQASHKRSSESAGSRASSNRDPNTYVVQRGDNLYLIAHKLGRSQDDLYSLNRQTIGPDSTKLKIGMVLKLPSSGTSN